jgi:hypothetical protein
MSIKSHAFGRVTLTGRDARKFKNQVIYGKAKPAAKASMKRGVVLVRKLSKTGILTLRSSSGRLIAKSN